MIKTARQLKGLVRNISKGDSIKALEVMTSYAIERFLERLSLSSYRDCLILKGGTLVATLLGIENRSTKDIDVTVKNRPLTIEEIEHLVKEVISVPLDDGTEFIVIDTNVIMDELDYPGVRVLLEAQLERIRIPFKIDFSTDDVITPSEINYSMKLLFEDRQIFLLAYNVETVLAEKLETILSRGTASTRMRDYYDIYALTAIPLDTIDYEILSNAFSNTCRKRKTIVDKEVVNLIVSEIAIDATVMNQWERYRRKYDYAANIDWPLIISAVRNTFRRASLM